MGGNFRKIVRAHITVFRYGRWYRMERLTLPRSSSLLEFPNFGVDTPKGLWGNLGENYPKNLHDAVSQRSFIVDRLIEVLLLFASSVTFMGPLRYFLQSVHLLFVLKFSHWILRNRYRGRDLGCGTAWKNRLEIPSQPSSKTPRCDIVSRSLFALVVHRTRSSFSYKDP